MQIAVIAIAYVCPSVCPSFRHILVFCPQAQGRTQELMDGVFQLPFLFLPFTPPLLSPTPFFSFPLPSR